MNILFVNYGNFTTNSLNHIGPFANALQAAGHSCVVAVTGEKETLSVVRSVQFIAATYAEVLARPALFPDGRPADLIHAWTPRECVRKFLLAYQRQHPSRLIVHLEDNEEHLLHAFTGLTPAQLGLLPDDEFAAMVPEALSHPIRYRNLLRLADGITIITPRLGEFVPPGVPVQLLPPGVDFDLYRPRMVNTALRSELGLHEGERVITYTGSTTFASAPEMLELITAVRLLNESGTRTRLVRTGFHPALFTDRYDFEWRTFTLDLGFVAKARLPALLALADVLVQPGHQGAFNDYRLPSKLPEFLAAGRPVILPATNLAAQLRDGTDALFLQTGTASEIARLCQRVFSDASLAAQLGENAAAAARRQFDLATITAALDRFYQQVGANEARTDWASLREDTSEAALVPASLRRSFAGRLPPGDPQLAAFDDLALIIAKTEQQLGRNPASQLLNRLEDELRHLRKLKWTEEGLAELAEARRLARIYQDEFVRVCQQELAPHLAQIATLQSKADRRENSFSWRSTAPLRFLRRKLLDPFRPAHVAPAANPEPASLPPTVVPPTGYLFKIHEPAFWHVPAGTITISGWCLGPDRQPISGLRARFDDRIIHGHTGLIRSDIAALHHSQSAAPCGFELKVILAAGTHALRLEVADDHGAWHLVAAPILTVFAHFHPIRAGYREWVDLYDTLTPALQRTYEEKLSALPGRPLISILLPVYNTSETWLARAIDSVRAQLYGHWELCIADDASTAPHIRPLLEKAAHADPRIKLVFRPVNGHISAASNSALDLATGEFVALLDHDDELAPTALAEVVLALAVRPDADLLYSDEDKIDEVGRRSSPNFKPDFLPDLFLGQNYLAHLAVYRAALLRQIGGFRLGYEGSQDWDLALRVTELTTPARIVHLPKILYHWRAIPGSTALALDQKHYHGEAARRTLADHLARTGRRAELLAVPGGHWRIRYLLPPTPPLVSIIIPTRNGLAYLRRGLESLRSRTTYPHYEILVVDNGSDDPATLAYLREITAWGVRVLSYPLPFNYSAINNFAAREARGELLALLNNDLEVITPDWLEEMAAQALRPEIGVVGALLYYPDDRIQHAGVVLGMGGVNGVGGVAGHAFKLFPGGTEGFFNRARLVQNYSAVTGACIVIRKALYEQVGGLDEQSLPVAFNDIDLCLRVRATGVRNLWTPFAEFYHHESASRGPEDTPAKQVRFRREVETMLARWGQALLTDPAYNPNLSLDSEDFALAFPPRLLP